MDLGGRTYGVRIARAQGRSRPLQMEGLERFVLRSEEEFAPKGLFGGSTIKSFLRGDCRSVRIVVLLRDMRQDKVACVGIETLGVRQELTDRMIGEMAGA